LFPIFRIQFKYSLISILFNVFIIAVDADENKLDFMF